jgi:RNA polymerase-interacting CarD/CdnL/TRCF family regulator
MLRADAKPLPADHKARYELLNGRLRARDVFQVAEAVRDMAWRQQRVGSLTTQGKRIYEEAMRILSGEIAASQGMNMADAEAQVRAKLGEILSSTITT